LHTVLRAQRMLLAVTMAAGGQKWAGGEGNI
jgi:hypothetical protein